MKFAYQFSNLYGVAHTKGNVLYTSDGNKLISPVGNRVSVFDLVSSATCTLPCEASKDIVLIALTPDDDLLLMVDEDGKSVLVNFARKVVLSHFNFREPVRCIKFSPDGSKFAAVCGRKVQIWATPAKHKEFTPFRLISTYSLHYDDVLCIDWSADGKYLVSGSVDMSLKVFAARGGLQPVTLTGHRNHVIGCAFGKENTTIYSVSRDGVLIVWQWSKRDLASMDEQAKKFVPASKRSRHLSAGAGKWTIEHRHFLKHGKVVTIDYLRRRDMMVVGFKGGVFALYSLPALSTVHSLRISNARISSCAINCSGEWLAFASARTGQLLVWEWQSETYILKQQGHETDVNALAYSPNGKLLVTGGEDGKVKVWNTQSGFCFVTFTEHTAAVSAVTFAPKGNGSVVFTAALDGTVRAYDLIRYRNFRTMTAPNMAQFSSVTTDPAGEIVCAGSLDGFEVFVWSVQTGKILDVLRGHEGPISGLAFSSEKPIMASSSWDRAVRLWQLYATKDASEVLEHQTEVLAVAFRPDGKELCSATMDGQLNFWDVETSEINGVIEGRKDVAGGRLTHQRTTSASSGASKFFSSVTYSADGQYILAAGNSKYLCIYHIAQKVLIKKIQLSINLSLDGILDFLNSKRMTDAGSLDLIDDDERYGENPIPGAQRRDLSLRTTKPAIRAKCIQFSPSGQAFSVATTEGLVTYSLDNSVSFDPFELDIDITPHNILNVVLPNKEFLKALIMSLSLGEQDIIRQVVEAVPPEFVQRTVADMPNNYLPKLVAFLSQFANSSVHLEFCLCWCAHMLTYHGQYLAREASSFMAAFRELQKSIQRHYDDISSICNDNQYSLEYLSRVGEFRLQAETKQQKYAAAADEEADEHDEEDDHDVESDDYVAFGSGDDDDDHDDDKSGGFSSFWGGSLPATIIDNPFSAEFKGPDPFAAATSFFSGTPSAPAFGDDDDDDEEAVAKVPNKKTKQQQKQAAAAVKKSSATDDSGSGKKKGGSLEAAAAVGSKRKRPVDNDDSEPSASTRAAKSKRSSEVEHDAAASQPRKRDTKKRRAAQ